MIVAGALLGQPLRCDGQQCECRARPDILHGLSKSPGGLQLPFRALGDQAQVNVALRPRLAARVGAE